MGTCALPFLFPRACSQGGLGCWPRCCAFSVHAWPARGPPQVFQSAGEEDKAQSCNDQVVKIWTGALCQVVLGVSQVRACAAGRGALALTRSVPCLRRPLARSAVLCPAGQQQQQQPTHTVCAPHLPPARAHVQTAKGLVAEAHAPAELPVGRLQLMEVVDMLLDIGRTRAALQGPESEGVGDVHFVAALALIQLEEPERAEEQLVAAAELHAHSSNAARGKLLEMARIMLNAI